MKVIADDAPITITKAVTEERAEPSAAKKKAAPKKKRNVKQ